MQAQTQHRFIVVPRKKLHREKKQNHAKKLGLGTCSWGLGCLEICLCAIIISWQTCVKRVLQLYVMKLKASQQHKSCTVSCTGQVRIRKAKFVCQALVSYMHVCIAVTQISSAHAGMHILLSACGLACNASTIITLSWSHHCTACLNLYIIHLTGMHACVNYYKNQKQYLVTNLRSFYNPAKHTQGRCYCRQAH